MLIAALLNAFTGRVTGIPNWISAGGALALSGFAIVVVLLEFIAGFEVIDPLSSARCASRMRADR
jgi:hypothetical protein